MKTVKIKLTEKQLEKIKKELELSDNDITEEEDSHDVLDMGLVDISGRGYKMMKFTVTQRQWEEVMGNNPSTDKHPNKPVTNVSYYDVLGFIEKLNDLQDEYEYRLPSEDEWQYCAGEQPDDLGDYAWYWDNCDNLQEVGKKKPNKNGLYDMLGNVWEWTSSLY